MSSPGEAASSVGDGDNAACGVTAQLVVAEHSCNRLGRVANPPGFSFTDWFRPGRRG
ncbi:MAG: hypothetical protein K0U80_12325 [Actinomycetia bacterium]|nr:hypothetical protein [Actinomycetes bacterium]MCH9759549.1 hypothetical protein [Actinomycetes bacterium]